MAHSRGKDEFYVGYLPLPWGHSRFLRIAVPALLWTLALVSFGLAWSQRDPGGAVWFDGVERTWTGVMLTEPYAMLMIEDGEVAGAAALLVEQGKRGAAERCRPFGGARVQVRGWLLERDGRRIIELAPDALALERIASSAAVTMPAFTDSGEGVDLRGEIVDSKCFLGAMKPGDGYTHKACATLCVRGGIPPMLVTRENPGTLRYYVLISRDGRAMPEELIEMIGEPVTAKGVTKTIGDMTFLAVGTGDVTRR